PLDNSPRTHRESPSPFSFYPHRPHPNPPPFPTRRSSDLLRAEVAGSPIHVSVVYPVSTESEFFDVMSRETGTAITHDITSKNSEDRKSTRLNSSHRTISYAVFCLKKKRIPTPTDPSRLLQ